jgi:hypothetical protein
LKGKAKEWLRSQRDGYFESWQGISNAFLSRYFSQKKLYDRRFDIMTFKQCNSEELIPAYNRFLALLHNFPPHSLRDDILLHIFYGVLNQASKILIYSVSCGSFFDNTVEECWQLLKKMKSNQ